MGRWTREEHNKFIDGLRKYGKNWKLIEDYVNTRSGSQIRSHAQKFFSRLEKQCHISKSEVFKYLDKISNDLLEFNSENEMLRKRKIWEVIKASNIDNCKGKADSVDAQVVQEKLNTLTANLECVMGGTSQILDPNTRDKYQHAWKEITKSIVEITQDLATEIDRENTGNFRSNCYKKFCQAVNSKLLGIDSEGGGASTSQEVGHYHSSQAPPMLSLGPRMHSSSEDNICVDPFKTKPRLKDFVKLDTPTDPPQSDFRRTRLPSFKLHDESEENLEKIRAFKEANSLPEAKRNRTNSLEL